MACVKSLIRSPEKSWDTGSAARRTDETSGNSRNHRQQEHARNYPEIAKRTRLIQGVQVNSFKSPSAEDLDHDYLWRCMKCLPNRGHIGIFNRSYYEEVLVVRVHPEFLAKAKLPPKLVDKNIWDERFEDIRNFEQYLARNGIVVRKFFLHVSKKEQKQRFLDRIDDPLKNWKFSSNDANERDYWDDYMQAYEEMIQETATKHGPWYVVPADNKWFTRVIVASAVNRSSGLARSCLSRGGSIQAQGTGRSKKEVVELVVSAE
jgi:polyphosphate kinase 2 (PPK2 family)